MGREKDRLIEEEERGWYSVTEKLVCDSCIEDTYLSDYIKRNGRVAACDYCGLDPEEADLRCVPFDELMDLIGEGLNWAYRSADDEGIPYESAEGGYAFSGSMLDSWDLVTDEIPITASDSVLEDILDALPQQIWCRRGFWSLSLYEALKFGWSEFVERVKYKTRYLFSLPEQTKKLRAESLLTEPKDSTIKLTEIFPGLPEQPKKSRSGPLLDEPKSTIELTEIFPREIESIGCSGDPDFDIDFDRQEGIPVHEMLDAIGQILRRMELVQIVNAGTIIYRVRIDDKSEHLEGPEGLGPPSREHATQPNRMSPAGIVMFYGATKPETAIVETFQPTREGADKKSVWVASFRVMKELKILDLTDLPPVPSIFDRERRDLRNGISFLHAFEEDFVEPIERDGREHIEYVPTQIVTEYIRQCFRTEDGHSVEGIQYRSSKREKGTACVLFIDGSNCGVPMEDWRKPEQVLQLLADQTRILDGAKADEWYPTD